MFFQNMIQNCNLMIRIVFLKKINLFFLYFDVLNNNIIGVIFHDYMVDNDLHPFLVMILKALTLPWKLAVANLSWSISWRKVWLPTALT